MNGRTYAVTFSAVAVSAAQDLVELTPADEKPIEIIGIELGQYSDAGDAQDELVSLKLTRGYGTSGSGGSAATPVAISASNAQAAGFSAEVNNTTQASAGTPVDLLSTAFNVRAGYINYFPEDARPRCSQAQTCIVLKVLAPTDSLTMNGTIYVRELD